MALDPGAMHQRIIDNLAEKTGKPIGHWLNLLDSAPVDRRKRVVLLKEEHGIGHHTAVAIVREKEGDVPWRDTDTLEAALAKAVPSKHRPGFNEMRRFLCNLPWVKPVPCRTYLGFKAERQFAVLKPSPIAGFTLGLALPRDGNPALKEARSLGSARITSKLDAEVGIEFLKEAAFMAYELDVR